MVMDSHFNEFPDSVNAFKFDDETVLPGFDQSMNLANGFKFKYDPLDINFTNLPFRPPSLDPGNFHSSSSVSSEANSPDDPDSDPVLKYLNQILLEENMEEKPSMFHDPLALQAAEKSFYDVLGEKYPSSHYRPPPPYTYQNVGSPDNFFESSSEYMTNSSSSDSISTDPHRIVDPTEYRSFITQNHPSGYSSNPSLQTSSQSSFRSVNNTSKYLNGLVDSSRSAPLVPDIFSDSDSIAMFKRGMEEASKFLPTGNQLIFDLDKYKLPPQSEVVAPEVVVKVEKYERDNSLNVSRGRKHHHPEDSDLEDERSNKQSAVYVDEVELSEKFDKVLLFTDAKGHPICCNNEELPERGVKNLHQNGQPHESNGGNITAKKQGNNSEAVDLRILLVSCAQSFAADDLRTANEQLKQIRQQSSPFGDASQRLANIFANGLEARLAGTGTQIYAASASKKISAAEKLEAYQVYLSSCPFKKISIFFANKMIMERAAGAKKLHIIDFGIQYGFQWPVLIQHLSTLPGGGPKLRITGIELPQHGFRPAELVEDTGRRLANYCKRFNVPFEYNAIATQNWEAIKVEDLKIESDEVVAVNCLFRFKNLLDETVVLDSPRDAVLKLIKEINPNIFVNAVINGSFSAPFFLTRFREALFHYSAMFDMFDTTIPRDNQQRLNFEKEFSGREALNVIACEGAERVERPETYKQWQIRNIRAGFKPLPLNQEILNKLRCKVKAGYHKDFLFDEDGDWLLQGWKGRIICASSCWIPA